MWGYKIQGVGALKRGEVKIHRDPNAKRGGLAGCRTLCQVAWEREVPTSTPRQKKQHPPTTTMKFNCTAKPRCTLTPTQAFQIYMLKPDSNSIYKNPKGESKSRSLATKFGVSPKAIRDIWNHRTWKLTAQYVEQQILNPPTQTLQVCRF